MDFSLSKTQIALRKSLIEFAENELNDNLLDKDENSEFSSDGWKKCAEMDIISMPFPEKYGGVGENILTTLIALEALGYACRDSGLLHALITQMLCGLQIQYFGTNTQKKVFIPPLCKGELIFAQAITEPDFGSDAMGIGTTAERCNRGFKINGSKMFISNGPIADVVLVFVVTDPEKKSFARISSLIVEKERNGFYRGKALDKMGLRTLQNGELVFNDCIVPHENLLGKRGQGMILFDESMQLERILMFALHIGVMERVLKTCVQYANERKQSGKPISQFQSISNKIARMKVNLEIGKLILYKSAWLKDQKKRANIEASISKLFISESLKTACLDAIQIHGGYGYMKEYEIERDLRDSIASTIYSGTSEIQKNIIARLSGLK